MKPIGGYFGLELAKGGEYHSDLLSLNTGRNAFEHILLLNKYKKIYLPYYSCDVLLEPLKRNNIDYSFYHLNDQFEPAIWPSLNENEGVLYINYFGLKDRYIKEICSKKKNVIIDNSQSFFSEPNSEMDTFYSARKFFGVPDGAYAYSKSVNSFPDYEDDHSSKRFSHLLIRHDDSPEAGYVSFQENELHLSDLPILKMSSLTKKILGSINYAEAIGQRIINFKYLESELKQYNLLKLNTKLVNAPFTYPLLIENEKLRAGLIGKRIYIPKYWESVKTVCPPGSLEVFWADNIFALPVDQRYGLEEMAYLVQTIKELL